MAQATIKRPKQATPSLRRETDTFVLDHLAWDTTRCLLQHAQSSNHKRAKTRQDGSGQELAQLPTELMDMLRMVDAFRNIFTAAHGRIILQSIPSDLEAEWRVLHFRLILLRFTTLLITRHNVNETTPAPAALAELRYRNRTRAAAWGANLDDVTRVFSEDLLKWYDDFEEKHADAGKASDMPMDVNSNTGGVIDMITTEVDEQADSIARAEATQFRSVYDTTAEETSPETIELIDLIPMFIDLTAEYGARDNAWHTTGKWLNLVADFMLQATLEKLLKRPRISHIVEAFAWGIEGREKEQADCAVDVNSVFCMPGEDANVDGTSVSSFAWPNLRDEYLELLEPEGTWDSGRAHMSRADRTQSTMNHLKQLAKQYPLAEIEDRLLAFLGSLCEGYAHPVLTQLENMEGGIELYGQELEEVEEENFRKLMSDRSK